MSSKVQRFAAISKVADNADGTITVFGIASTEAVDAHGEIVTKAAMENALPDFMKYGTGALRSMHQPIAAGTVTKVSVNDAGQTEIEAIVVDPVEVLKVQTGTYKGFSIGGSKVPGGYDNVTKTINALRLTEISLVDRPANPDAVITMFKLEDEPEAVVTVSADDAAAVDALATLLDKGEVSPARLVELVEAEIAKSKAPPFATKDDKDDTAEATSDDGNKKTKAKKTDDTEDDAEPTAKGEGIGGAVVDGIGGAIEKGMYSVSRFAEIIQSIGYMVSDAEWEADCEKDGSPVPAKLRAWLTDGAALFGEMAAEEIAEFVAAFKTPETTSAAITVVALSDTAGELRKSLDAAAGESLSAYLNIAKAHMPETEVATMALSAGGFAKATDAILARLAPEADAIAKLADANATIAKLQAERDEAIAKFNAAPAPSAARLRVVVEKGADLPVAPVVTDGPVLKADGSVDREATAMAQIKKVHQSGGQALRSH